MNEDPEAIRAKESPFRLMPSFFSTPDCYPMRRTIFLICAANALVLMLFCFYETTEIQFLAMALLAGWFIAFLFSFVHLFSGWSGLRWRALLPFIACVLALPLGGRVGISARDIYFRSRITELTQAVDVYRATGLLPPVSWRGPKVTPFKMEGREVSVVFWWGSGFPVKHTALIYCSADDPTGFFEKYGWRHGYSLKSHWWVKKD